MHTPFKVPASPRLRDAVLLLVVAAPALILAVAGVPAPQSVLFDLGPNDADHISGFEPHYEIDGPLATRWTTYRAEIDLPLTVRGGPADVSYRYSRVLPETAVVEVLLDGRLIDRFTCRGGVWSTRTTHLAALPPTPLRIELVIDSHDRRNLGLKLEGVPFEQAHDAVVSAMAQWMQKPAAAV